MCSISLSFLLTICILLLHSVFLYGNQRAYWARNVVCSSLGDRTVVSGRSDQ
ncbi:uncharacterized protein EURHEDRAFT_413917 [Aspergillus ruber CBS 135680]|uniref:Uncharacterized protein n=1 Tax=Aspergillus ruber (strain CBS 135680) TaxID=1388766 RepID=A0A017SB99_ASPRC|nr:uncharacterized protein EURHEDRAFT_413917 [Aspergillus ruber CBS 135680]EYE93909.1 hypothetical protein EURHEDRAFT_413917 [Aspergillus ruber CBS 135680]